MVRSLTPSFQRSPAFPDYFSEFLSLFCVCVCGPSTARHPDRHQGNSKIAAEAKFKELQQAYQLLQQPGALSAAARGEPSFSGGGEGGGGWRPSQPGGGGASRMQDQEWWSKKGHYGAASQPGYNPHSSYMGFGGPNNQSHWYEDTAAAAKAEDQKRMLRSW